MYWYFLYFVKEIKYNKICGYGSKLILNNLHFRNNTASLLSICAPPTSRVSNEVKAELKVYCLAFLKSLFLK